LFDRLDLLRLTYFSPFSTSSNPFIENKRDSIPAKIDADITTSQFTSVKSVDVPIVATAVCATVLTARIPAALNHFLVITFSSLKQSLYHIKKETRI